LQTTTLRELVTAPKPLVSVYYEDSHDTADAEKQLELKWRELHDTLSGKGAPDTALKALEAAATDRERAEGTAGRALIAAGSEVLVDERFDEVPAESETRVSELPYLLPLARYAEPGPTHVVAVADHIGADVYLFDGYRRELDQSSVEGQDHPVHKARTGGVGNRNTQARAEETVRHNLEDAADAIAGLAQRSGAELVVVAGEVQARRGLYNELPEGVRRIATEVTSGARAEGSSLDELTERVRELIDAARHERVRDSVQSFDAELGKDEGLAVQGLQAVTEALHEGNVRTLLFGNPRNETVFVGEGFLTDGDPTQIAVQREELEAFGVTEMREHRADEAVPVAAVAVDADLVYAGEELELTDGFGALLRYR
jgi:peptide subunit release factor 1 (eRF1)